jgi:hypothetical protein
VYFAGMQTQVRAAGWEAHVRQSDVPTLPRVGIDTLTVGATVYQIRDASEDVIEPRHVLDDDRRASRNDAAHLEA